LILALALASGAGFQTAVRADWVVSPGFDLFQTVPADTSFPGLGNLMGVQLGTFNFGGTIGTVPVNPTDTIVQRTTLIDVPTVAGSSGSSPLVMRALQLETVIPVNFLGNGLDNYFVTLTPTAQSIGQINVTFASNAGGTFTSTLNVFFDIHKGSLTGPVVASSETVLTSTPTPWGRIPPPNALTITGVNQFLLGDGTRNGDFWVGGEIHNGPHGVVDSGTLPEPSAWVMIVAAGAMVPAYARWRRRRI
jgi:hypothetical protein